MNIEEIREYILSLPNVEEIEQFPDIPVYKIGGKWFAVYMLERPQFIVVKCDPDRALALRDKYEEIRPAWHFNKRHWNELVFGKLPSELVMREIRHSYLSVIKKNVVPKSLKVRLLLEAETAGIDDAPPVL